MSEQMWETRYSAPQRVWSGEPNAVLVAEAARLPVGSALDLGCGEGADAIWLARRGWQVTGIDFAAAALRRAASQAEAAGVEVRWLRADLSTWQPEGRFDLVSVQYFHGDPDVRRRVHRLAWQACGGTLIIAGHDAAQASGPPLEVRYDADEVLTTLGMTAADPEVLSAERRVRADAVDVAVILRREAGSPLT